MRSKILSLLAVAASLGFAQAASAADMPTKAPHQVPVAVPFNWTGLYLGLNAGYVWGRSNLHDVGGYNGPPDFTYDPRGFQGGAHFGYNYQINQFVLGIEGELGFLSWKKSAQYPPYVGVRSGADSIASTSDGAFGVIAGRAGIAFDRTLLFVKGGGIFTGVHNSFTDTDPFGTTLVSGTDTKDRCGWTVGGGVEYAFAGNWAGRIEYAHYDFGTASHTATSAGGTPFTFDHSLRADSVRAGITYLFH